VTDRKERDCVETGLETEPGMGEETSVTTGTETLYLIDGHAQFFRAYHAIRTGLTSPVTHEPTNMTYGFVAMILKVLRDYRPDYLVVAIDVSGRTSARRSTAVSRCSGRWAYP
jgi:5'-3' exonuclease